MDLIFYVLFAGIVVLAFLKAHADFGKRTDAVRRAARSLGLSFAPKIRDSTREKFGGFYLLSFAEEFPGPLSILFGGKRNEIWGTLGDGELSVFDFSYGGGGAGHTSRGTVYKQTVFSIEDSRLELPYFIMQPEHWSDKLGQLISSSDIDFLNRPDFSSTYFLRGEDERAVRRFFSSDILRYFERNTGLSVEGSGNLLLIYQRSKRCEPDEFGDFIAACEKIYRLFLRT